MGRRRERSTEAWTWVLRAAWLFLPVAVGPALADVLHGCVDTFRTTASVGLWALWAVGLLATLVPHPVSLTAVRIGGPAVVAAAAWAAFATGATTAVLVALPIAAVAAAGSLSAPVGDRFVDGASYGDERRFLLRAPGPVVLLLGPLAWAVVLAGATSGPLLLARGLWPAGAVATAVGLPLALGAVRALHQLSRRWVVMVPAGLVVHDHLALAEPTLFQRSGLSSVGPAPADTRSLDLTQGARGLALEVRCNEPHDVVPAPAGIRRRRVVGEAVAVDAFILTPVRPDALLAEAARRGIPIG